MKIRLGERQFADARLAGVWHGNVQGNDEYLHIFNLVDGKSLKLIRVTHINTGGIENHEILEMFPTESGKHHYLNIKFNCPDAKTDAKPNVTKEGWVFARYDITPAGELDVSLIGYDCLKAAIDKNLLHGNAWETTWGSNAQVSDNSKELLEFVDSSNAEFKPYGVFRHVVDAPLQK